jgi:hypothetical protein
MPAIIAAVWSRVRESNDSQRVTRSALSAVVAVDRGGLVEVALAELAKRDELAGEAYRVHEFKLRS